MLKESARFLLDLTIKSLSFRVKSARAVRNFFSKFKLSQLAGVGLNVISIVSVIPSLIKHANEIGGALKVLLDAKKNEASLEEWKKMHAGKTPKSHLFYESLKFLVCFIYVPIAVGEIYAIAAGASLAFVLPVTLVAGYALFMAYNLACISELSDQWKRLKKESETLGDDPEKLAANAQKRKELQNEMITKSISLFLLGAGLVCGLIGLGVFGIGALGLVAGSPVLLGVSIAIFTVKIVNYFLPKDFLRRGLFNFKNWISEIFKPSPDRDSEINMSQIESNGVGYNNLTHKLKRENDSIDKPEKVNVREDDKSSTPLIVVKEEDILNQDPTRVEVMEISACMTSGV